MANDSHDNALIEYNIFLVRFIIIGCVPTVYAVQSRFEKTLARKFPSVDSHVLKSNLTSFIPLQLIYPPAPIEGGEERNREEKSNIDELASSNTPPKKSILSQQP